MPKFDLNKFIKDVFDPQPNDVVAVMVDVPHGSIKDNNDWKDRRAMANEWLGGFERLSVKIGFKIMPLIKHNATGVGGSPLPDNGWLGDNEISLTDTLNKCTCVVAMSEFSITVPLVKIGLINSKFRAASMPGVTKDMEEYGMAADYSKVKELCFKIKDYITCSDGVEVAFTTGHKCYFDIRYRKAEFDCAVLSQEAWGVGDECVQNLPSGEAYIAPYEGEKNNDPSRTSGDLPVKMNNEIVVYKVEQNRIVEVLGDGNEAGKMRDYFAVKDGRCNIGELGFGCNDMARGDSGYIIEDEKAGFHWAYGISDHQGGVIGEKDFIVPSEAVHTDIIYSRKSDITVARLDVIDKAGKKTTIMKNGWYTF